MNDNCCNSVLLLSFFLARLEPKGFCKIVFLFLSEHKVKMVKMVMMGLWLKGVECGVADAEGVAVF